MARPRLAPSGESRITTMGSCLMKYPFRSRLWLVTSSQKPTQPQLARAARLAQVRTRLQSGLPTGWNNGTSNSLIRGKSATGMAAITDHVGAGKWDFRGVFLGSGEKGCKIEKTRAGARLARWKHWETWRISMQSPWQIKPCAWAF